MRKKEDDEEVKKVVQEVKEVWNKVKEVDDERKTLEEDHDLTKVQVKDLFNNADEALRKSKEGVKEMKDEVQEVTKKVKEEKCDSVESHPATYRVRIGIFIINYRTRRWR